LELSIDDLRQLAQNLKEIIVCVGDRKKTMQPMWLPLCQTVTDSRVNKAIKTSNAAEYELCIKAADVSFG